MKRHRENVNNYNNADESSASIEIGNLDDHLLDEKIKKANNLLHNPLLRKVMDGRKKLTTFLQKLLGERKRREQRVQVQKAEPDTLSSVQELVIIGREDFSCTTRNSDYPDSSGLKLEHLSPSSHNALPRNANHSLITYSKRASNYFLREEDSSQRKKQVSKCSTPTSILREENACRSSDEKKRKPLPLAKEGWNKKKDSEIWRKCGSGQQASKIGAMQHDQSLQVTELIDLDDEDDKQPNQLYSDWISERWFRMKDMKLYYPARDDPDSVEICYIDMECLEPFSYLSSPIMNFYIRYLQRPASLTLAQRNNYHFFNTYFYSKLDEALCARFIGIARPKDVTPLLGSGESKMITISKKLSHFEKDDSLVKLRRWLKGVTIFEKAYVFLPIYYDLHWSLAIICFPPQEEKSGPLVLHLDSLGLHASQVIFRNIKSFLKIEWEYLNQAGLPSHIPIDDSTWIMLIEKIENRKVQVPQQDNSYDCGLFVLYFIERFIKDTPSRIRRADLNMFGRKWFRPDEASSLRHSIKGLLGKLFQQMRNTR